MDQHTFAHLLNELEEDEGYFYREMSDLTSSIDRLIDSCDYIQANHVLSSASFLKTSQKNIVRKLYSDRHLMEKDLEWTHHGIWRTFRFWSTDEKVSYLQNCLDIARLLGSVTPYISFRFGSVLGFVRDNDFIPHDDDMDIIVAFKDEPGIKFQHTLALLQAALEQRGVKPYNHNVSHMTANGVDIFIGYFNNEERVSWFPSKRDSKLLMSDIFPAKPASILGLECMIPCNVELYLEATYGPTWHDPGQGFSHPWDLDEYSEYV